MTVDGIGPVTATAFRVVIASGHGPNQRECTIAERRKGGLGSAAEHDVCVVPPNLMEGLTDGDCASLPLLDATEAALHELERRDATTALVSMCAGGAQASEASRTHDAPSVSGVLLPAVSVPAGLRS